MMQRHLRTVCFAILASAAVAGSTIAQDTPAGLIATDQGGASGYQHGLERSQFITGGATEAELRRVEENGFLKVVGPNGVFATNRRNGLVIAVRGASGNKGEPIAGLDEAKEEYLLDPDKHNEQVKNYLLAAGVPKDQIGGVHATTSLSWSGSLKDLRSARPKIDGYATVLERIIDNKYRVVDSVAWARMNKQGEVVGEWLYWPAIPANVLADARRIEEYTRSSGKNAFLARLPAGLPPGNIVIRHSSATSEAPFEVFASYDVVERKPSSAAASMGNMSIAPPGVAVVRHFDVDGMERRLPSEKLNTGKDYPEKKKP
jgi:hypothetical protein